ncbi:hypothetical protein BC351_03415 [Paenibacillus ferrarius]|uniref:DUF2642 domain-containing protein n=1 Tax=Paenibacillus ferrarius TaxID=1469647 RepID=A0A1V4HJV7_9BACL|nr:hypothetical protein [Paenibacillus ferrarius]OPH57585.1 hypothetical protein BC351_03415 [Paenibacillus ferrarius]
MMIFNLYIGKLVHIELLGDRDKMGYLIDAGSDIIVIYMDKKYVYLPITHIKNIELNTEDNANQDAPPDPISQTGHINFVGVLHNAVDRFVEIYLSDHQTLHGYVKYIAQDYLVFYSALYPKLYIPIIHIKWISPYESHQTPYSMNQKNWTTDTADSSLDTLPPTFGQVLKGLEGEMICLDAGLHASQIGLLEKMNDSFIELVTADENKLHFNVQHIRNCISFVK